MTPSEKRDMPHIIVFACLGVALVIALATFWK